VRFIVRPLFRAGQAQLRDISESGVGLITAEPLSTTARLALELHTGHGSDSGLLTAWVRHATLLPDGSWLIGCSLTRNLSGSEIQALLAGGLGPRGSMQPGLPAAICRNVLKLFSW
jgi:hypothetical protein